MRLAQKCAIFNKSVKFTAKSVKFTQGRVYMYFMGKRLHIDKFCLIGTSFIFIEKISNFEIWIFLLQIFQFSL